MKIIEGIKIKRIVDDIHGRVEWTFEQEGPSLRACGWAREKGRQAWMGGLVIWACWEWYVQHLLRTVYPDICMTLIRFFLLQKFRPCFCFFINIQREIYWTLNRQCEGVQNEWFLDRFGGGTTYQLSTQTWRISDHSDGKVIIWAWIEIAKEWVGR